MIEVYIAVVGSDKPYHLYYSESNREAIEKAVDCFRRHISFSLPQEKEIPEMENVGAFYFNDDFVVTMMIKDIEDE